MNDNHWVLPVDSNGVMVLPPSLLEKTSWTENSILQWTLNDGCVKVRECDVVSEATAESEFDQLFERVVKGETIVIVRENGDRVLFTPLDAELTSLTQTV